MLGPGPVLPEIDGLPGAEQQPPASERQGEGGAGEGRADVGGHVIGTFVVMAIGAQIAPAADRSHALLGHEGLQVSGQIDQHPRVSVFVDGERAGGVQTGQVGQAGGQTTGSDLAINGGADVGEALAAGVKAELVQALAQHLRFGAVLPHSITRWGPKQAETVKLRYVGTIAGEIRSGTALMFHPEVNAIFKAVIDSRSGTPAFKRVPVLARAGRGAVADATARSLSSARSQCAVPEIREQSLCGFSRIESAVAVQMNGAVFLL